MRAASPLSQTLPSPETIPDPRAKGEEDWEGEWELPGLSEVMLTRDEEWSIPMSFASDQRQCPVAISGVFYNLLM